MYMLCMCIINFCVCFVFVLNNDKIRRTYFLSRKLCCRVYKKTGVIHIVFLDYVIATKTKPLVKI